MPAPTAASISQAKESSYSAELKERLLQVSSEYRRVLSFLEADIKGDLSEVFAEHLKLERAVFRRFAASLKVWKGLAVADPQVESEVHSLVLRQRHLHSLMSREKERLRVRLEKGTLPPRPRRLYNEVNTFLDISC